MTPTGRILLAKLRAVAAQIALDEQREAVLVAEIKASYFAQGKGFTDPRSGITYFPPRQTRSKLIPRERN